MNYYALDLSKEAPANSSSSWVISPPLSVVARTIAELAGAPVRDLDRAATDIANHVMGRKGLTATRMGDPIRAARAMGVYAVHSARGHIPSPAYITGRVIVERDGLENAKEINNVFRLVATDPDTLADFLRGFGDQLTWLTRTPDPYLRRRYSTACTLFNAQVVDTDIPPVPVPASGYHEPASTGDVHELAAFRIGDPVDVKDPRDCTAANACPHPEPLNDQAAWSAWNATHPNSIDMLGHGRDRICMPSPLTPSMSRLRGVVTTAWREEMPLKVKIAGYATPMTVQHGDQCTGFGPVELVGEPGLVTDPLHAERLLTAFSVWRAATGDLGTSHADGIAEDCQRLAQALGGWSRLGEVDLIYRIVTRHRDTVTAVRELCTQNPELTRPDALCRLSSAIAIAGLDLPLGNRASGVQLWGLGFGTLDTANLRDPHLWKRHGFGRGKS